MTNKITELLNEFDDLEDTNLVVKSIIECKKYLDTLPNSETSVNQKLWLLAFEASEARLSKMGENKTQESIDNFSQSMQVLKKAIVTGLLI
jgi:hypothetical protein